MDRPRVLRAPSTTARSLARALGRRVRPVVTAARLRRPLLSVVVPVYNVEKYLDECLDSILRQPLHDLEVILVDDGSTDASAEIARRRARRSARVRLVRQENAGLGAARNVGARRARGRLLAFVDSDDTLPDDAYSPMVRAIDRTGSDIAVGMLVRDPAGRTSAMPLMRRNHERQRLAVTVEEMPEILADVFASNKVFRRAFWEEAGLAFPEGVRYEDQVGLTKAFLLARGIDVLTETVYLWRIREDRSSITQFRHEVADLRDRLWTKQASTDLVTELASPEVQRVWWSVVLPVDMFLYFRAVPGCTDDYWETLRDGFRELWAQSPVPFTAARIPVQRRLMGWLVEHGRREQLEDLVAFLDEHSGSWPLEVRGERVVAALPGLDDPDADIPTEVFCLADHELAWEARLLATRWSPGLLRLEGFALIRNVPTLPASTTLLAELVDGSGAAAPVAVTARQEPRATSWVGSSAQDHDAAGFTLDLDLARLAERAGGGLTSHRFALRRTVEQVERGGSFTSWAPQSFDDEWHQVGEGGSARLVVRDGELVLEVRSP